MLRHLFSTLIDALVWAALAFCGYVGGLLLIYGPGEKWELVAFLGMYLLMMAYFSTEMFGRRTLGRKLTRTTLATRDGDAPGRRARIVRWLIKCSPWIMALALSIVASKLPDNRFVDRILVDYPKAIENHTVAPLANAMPGSEPSRLEIVLYPPLFAIRFLRLGMVPLTILGIGYLLILVPPHRTLLDRLSGTMIAPVKKHAPGGFEVVPTAAVKAPAGAALHATMSA